MRVVHDGDGKGRDWVPRSSGVLEFPPVAKSAWGDVEVIDPLRSMYADVHLMRALNLWASLVELTERGRGHHKCAAFSSICKASEKPSIPGILGGRVCIPTPLGPLESISTSLASLEPRFTFLFFSSSNSNKVSAEADKVGHKKALLDFADIQARCVTSRFELWCCMIHWLNMLPYFAAVLFSTISLFGP